MAADFIDGLVKTISQTTKELGKATKGLSERAEQTIEAQKIRNRIAGEEISETGFIRSMRMEKGLTVN